MRISFQFTNRVTDFHKIGKYNIDFSQIYLGTKIAGISNQMSDRLNNHSKGQIQQYDSIFHAFHLKNMFAINPIIMNQMQAQQSLMFRYRIMPVLHKKVTKSVKPKLQYIKKNIVGTRKQQSMQPQRLNTQYSNSEGQISSVVKIKNNQQDNKNGKLQENIKFSSAYHFHNLDQLLIEKILQEKLQKYDCNSVNSSRFKDSREQLCQKNQACLVPENCENIQHLKQIEGLQKSDERWKKVQKSNFQRSDRQNNEQKSKKYTPIKRLDRSESNQFENSDRNQLRFDYSPVDRFKQVSSNDNSPYSHTDSQIGKRKLYSKTKNSKLNYAQEHIPISVRQSRKFCSQIPQSKHYLSPSEHHNYYQSQHSRILIMATSNKYIESLIRDKNQD